MDVYICVCTGGCREMKAQLDMVHLFVLRLLWTFGTFNSVTCVHKTWCSPPVGYDTVVNHEGMICLY